MKWENVVNRVEEFEKGKQDFNETSRLIKMQDDGLLFGSKFKNGYLGDWSQTQLYNRLGMPTRYFKNLMEEGNYDLVKHHVNYHLSTKEDYELFIRTRFMDEVNYVRGILSSKYSVFDNIDLVNILTDVVGNAEEDSYTINMNNINEERFYLRMTFNKLQRSLGQTIIGEEDIVKVGVHIANSEVGKSSVYITPLVYRLVCNNGLMGWRTDGSIYRQRHLWLKPDEMRREIAAAISNALKLGSEITDMMMKSKEYKVDDPIAVIDELAKNEKFSKELTARLKESWDEEPDKTVYGITNAITRTARDFEADRRVELETFASKVLDKMVA